MLVSVEDSFSEQDRTTGDALEALELHGEQRVLLVAGQTQKQGMLLAGRLNPSQTFRTEPGSEVRKTGVWTPLSDSAAALSLRKWVGPSDGALRGCRRRHLGAPETHARCRTDPVCPRGRKYIKCLRSDPTPGTLSDDGGWL